MHTSMQCTRAFSGLYNCEAVGALNFNVAGCNCTAAGGGVLRQVAAAAAAASSPQRLTITRPDDWHLHVRDGQAMRSVVPHTARDFARAIIMPNLVPPVTNAALVGMGTHLQCPFLLLHRS